MAYDPGSARVAVVTANPDHAHYDRQALTQLEFKRIEVFASGEDASESLTAAGAELVLVDWGLEDMDGCSCVRLLKSAHESRLTPLVMVTSENRQDRVLDAISAGCSGYVLRPYSIETFERHMKTACESACFGQEETRRIDTAKDLVQAGQFDQAIDEFEDMVSNQNQSRKYFDMGMDFLSNQQYGKAIIAFNKAVKFNEMFAEAYKGLADAHKGKGNVEEYRKYIHKAADIYALQDRLQETKELFVEILKLDPDAVNPYNSLGVELRKKDDLPGALHAYNRALELSPTDEHLHYNIAKAYLFAKDNESAAEHLRRAMEINPDFSEAEALLDRLSRAKKKKKSRS